MSSRKITLRIKEKDLLEILQDLTELKGRRKFWNKEEIQITLDLEDKRETYEYLCKSKRILGWELGDSVLPDGPEPVEPEEDVVEESPVIVEEPKKPERKVDKLTDYASKFSGHEDWNGLCLFIECSWRVAKKSPGVIFGTPLFKSSLMQELEIVQNNPVPSERILLEKVLESYYSGVDYIDAVEDTIGKIRVAWKTLNKHESLTSVSIRLYKNT